MEHAIYVVATPIGNLNDISQRAIDILTGVDLVAAEDTRHSKKLLSHLGLKKEMHALHDHNERQVVNALLDKVEGGVTLAVVSDAGTPLISDPGYVLVSEARKRGIKIVPIPGASAVIAALSASGLPCDRFVFEGFLPAKAKAKQDALSALEGADLTTVFYESSHRIVDTLEVLAATFPDRAIVIARELTKSFETFISGSAEQVHQQVCVDTNQQKGEFVLIVDADRGAKSQDVTEEGVRLLRLLADQLPPKKAAAIVAEHHGLDKKVLYKILVDNLL